MHFWWHIINEILSHVCVRRRKVPESWTKPLIFNFGFYLGIGGHKQVSSKLMFWKINTQTSPHLQKPLQKYQVAWNRVFNSTSETFEMSLIPRVNTSGDTTALLANCQLCFLTKRSGYCTHLKIFLGDWRTLSLCSIFFRTFGFNSNPCPLPI